MQQLAWCRRLSTVDKRLGRPLVEEKVINRHLVDNDNFNFDAIVFGQWWKWRGWILKLEIKVTYDVLSVCDTTMLGKRNFEPLLQDLSLWSSNYLWCFRHFPNRAIKVLSSALFNVKRCIVTRNKIISHQK